MCGISGIIGVGGSELDPSIFSSLASIMLNKRGPEYFGSQLKNDVLLCHNRLKIIDLSEEANQPMNSNSGKSSIVYNGEIYNFKNLAEEIKRPEIISDTKLLLEYYEVYGIQETLKSINGMFAFTLIDWEKSVAFICRDRFGQKPLYYSTEKGFIFSSDIRLISKVNSKNLSLNLNTIDYYLSELSSPQPYTIWNEVMQVKPAHYLTTNLEGTILSETNYWNLNAVDIKEKSEDEYLLEIESLLVDAIKKREVSDVKIGCFLSGGIDSGLITALMATNSPDKISTYTVKFSEKDFDESKDANLVVDRYNTNHHEVEIRPNIEADIQTIIEELGEPFADSSAIPMYYISKEIKAHVTVAISGDGGDEMFGGYLDYGESHLAEVFESKYPNKNLQNIKTIWSKFYSRLKKSAFNYGSVQNYLEIESPFQLSRGMGFSPNSDFVKNYFHQKLEIGACFLSKTTQLMAASLQTRLLNDYLVKVDRMSMANSLEIRSPFLDYRIAELAFSIPNSLKFKNGELKYLLKKLGEKYLYPDVFQKKKRGFEVPIKHWLKKELSSFAEDLLIAFDKRNLVPINGTKLLKEHNKNIADHTHRIWAIICLEIWLQKNL